MTTERAIEILLESKRQNKIMRHNPNTFFSVSDIVSGEKNAQERIDALDRAICVLREQQERENPKPLTNANRIRSMSDEELARWLVFVRADVRTTRHASIGEPAVRENIEWLQQPAKED